VGAESLIVDGSAMAASVGESTINWYSFAASSGGDYTITLETTSGNADVCVYHENAQNLVANSSFPRRAPRQCH